MLSQIAHHHQQWCTCGLVPGPPVNGLPARLRTVTTMVVSGMHSVSAHSPEHVRVSAHRPAVLTVTSFGERAACLVGFALCKKNVH